jgi:spermidine synthase
MTIRRRLILSQAIILFGAFATTTQIIFLREFLVVANGNELFLGLIFFCWFVGITIGALTAAQLADRIRNLLAAIVCLLLIQCLIVPVEIALIRSTRSLLQIPASQYIPFLPFFAIALAHVLPFSVITGIVFPLFCRYVTQCVAGDAESIGTVYYLEALGSIAGGIVFTFVFVLYLRAYTTVMLVGLLIGLNCACVAGFVERAILRKILVFSVVVAGASVVLLGTGLDNRLERWTEQLRWKAMGAGIRLVASVNSKYQQLSLAYQAGQYSLLSNGEFISSFPDDYSAAGKVHFIMTEHPDPRRVLLVGSGDEELVKHLLLYPVESIDYVEMDEKVLSLVRDYLPEEDKRALEDPRVHIHHVDGRQFVKARQAEIRGEQNRYDLVILSLPEPSTSAFNRFYTREFFQEVRAILSENGVVSTSISSAVNYFGREVTNYVGSLYKTMRSVFREVIVTPGTVAYLFASPRAGVVTTDIETLRQRFLSRGISTEYFSQYNFYSLLQPSQVRLTRDAVISALPYVRINTDLNPITYFFNLVMWARFSGAKSNWFFQATMNLRLIYILAIIGAFAVLRILYLAIRRPPAAAIVKFNGMFLIAATGFFGMATEIIMIDLFQNIFGYIYQKIGVIVALFMAGLALGSLVLTRLLPQTLRESLRALLSIEGVMLVFLLLLILFIPVVTNPGKGAMSWSLVEILFYVCVGGAGFLAGAEFPLIGKLFVLCKEKIGFSAGVIDCADHLGAAFGALITGVVLVPALGIIDSFTSLALLKLLGILLILVSWQKTVRLEQIAPSSGSAHSES